MTPPGRGDPPHDDDPPLELADVPRRLPRGPTRDLELPAAAPPPWSATPPVPLPVAVRSPGGRAYLDEPSPWPRRVVLLLLAAAAVYGTVRFVQWLTHKNVVAIRSPYVSSTGVTIMLPGGTGWRTDRSQRLKQRIAVGWMRGDLMFRGPSMDTSDEFAVVMRVHVPGAFARSVDPETMRRGLERALEESTAAAGAGTKNLQCSHERTWRSDVAVVCYGRIVMPFRELPAGVYMWVANDDDVIGIAYAADGPITPLETMARTAH